MAGVGLELTPVQELRRTLVFFALETCRDTEVVVDTAARMEDYVLRGRVGESAASPSEVRSSDGASGGGSGPEARDDARVSGRDGPRPRQKESGSGVRRSGIAETGGSPGGSTARRRFGRNPFAGRRPTLPPRKSGDRLPGAEDVSRFIAERGVTRPALTLTSVVNFLRSRDYVVVRADDGHFVVDGRQRLKAGELLSFANAVRRRMKQPEFPQTALQAG